MLLLAGLIRARHFERWEDAFNAVQSVRSTVKLNPAMRHALSLWQEKYSGTVSSTPSITDKQKQ
jgi:hypothetical protein